MTEPIELTAAQLQTLRLLAAGLTTRQIARRLQVSFGAVRSRRGRLMEALGAQSTAHAVAIAYETGILGGPR